jgi:hypothetical protein
MNYLTLNYIEEITSSCLLHLLKKLMMLTILILAFRHKNKGNYWNVVVCMMRHLRRSKLPRDVRAERNLYQRRYRRWIPKSSKPPDKTKGHIRYYRRDKNKFFLSKVLRTRNAFWEAWRGKNIIVKVWACGMEGGSW